MASRDIRLIRRLDDAGMVQASLVVLEIALQNILENAIGFSPRGSSIVLTVTRNLHTVELRIDDEGPGIEADKINHVFERYFSSRQHRSEIQSVASVTPAGHSGLGLWIVRRNIELLGGRVTAANRIGGGLSVAIVLPRNGD